MTEASLMPRPVDASAISDRGFVQTIKASPAERVAIAAAFGLIEVKALGGEATLVRTRGESIRISGRVTADIVQACVVTLDPVPQHIDEEFSLRLVPEGDAEAAPSSQGEIFVDIEHEDPPDTYSGKAIDLGAIILEHVALAIDPYPRAAGAELPAEPETPDPADSPFAVLSRLKPPPRT